MQTKKTNYGMIPNIFLKTCFLSLISISIFGQNNLSVDTFLAKEYFEQAKCLFEDMKYDSSALYYKKAAEMYRENKEWDKHVGSLNWIVKANLELSNVDTALIYSEKAISIVNTHFKEKHLKSASTYFYMGRCLYNIGKYNEALEWYNKALDIRYNFFGEEHLDIADTYNNIALCYDEIDNYDSALLYHNKVLNVRTKILGNEHPDLAATYNNIGVCYSKKSVYNKAIEYYTKALNIRAKDFTLLHLDIAGLYSNIGVCYRYEGNYIKAMENYNKALDMFIKILDHNHPRIAGCYNNIGVCYMDKGNYDMALQYHNKALDIQAKKWGYNHPDVARSYTNIGVCYKNMGNYDIALQHFNKSITIREKLFGYDYLPIASSYTGIGNCYSRKGNFNLALQYHNKALNLRIKILGGNHPLIAYSYTNIGICYKNKRKYDLALEHHYKALSIAINTLGSNHINVASVYGNIGVCYQQKGDSDQALVYHFKSLDIGTKILGYNHPDIAVSYNNIGICFSDKGNHKKALEYHQKALRIQTEVFTRDHPDMARSRYNIALQHIRKKEYEKALTEYQQALMVLSGHHFNDTTITTNPTFSSVTEKLGLLNVLNAKAQALSQIDRDKNDINYLELSFATYQLTISLMDSMRFEITTPESRQDLMDDAISIYNDAIEQALYLQTKQQKKNYLQQAFAIVEKSKAFLLLEGIKDNQAKYFANLPDTLLIKENSLKVDIAYYEKKVFDVKNTVPEKQLKQDSIDLALYQDRLFEKKRALEELIALLEKDYPQYYKLKYDLNVASMEDIQEKMREENGAFVEYFVGDSSIFIFVITPENYEVKRIKKDFPIAEWVDTLRENIYGHWVQQGRLNKDHAQNSLIYARMAFRLYEKLVAPIESMLPEKVIIAPDNILHFVPFEVLLSTLPEEKVDFKQLDYLLNNYQISYNYSATLFKALSERKQKRADKALLAFAPEFEGEPIASRNLRDIREGFGRLKYNVSEAESVCKLFDGDIFTDSTATEALFREISDQYQIIHLSTHGKSNDEIGDYSFIAFSETGDSIPDEERLYVRELYNMNLTADMVVLSACETGLGEMRRGEGVISLAHGFTYAGVGSTLTSLWNVNDELTVSLMERFYGNIKLGMAKDEALRQAKLSFIKEEKRADPHFWSAFVISGNMEPIVFESTLNWWYFGLTILILIFIVFVFWRRLFSGKI